MHVQWVLTSPLTCLKGTSNLTYPKWAPHQPHQTSYCFVLISVNAYQLLRPKTLGSSLLHYLLLFLTLHIQSTRKFCQLCPQNIYLQCDFLPFLPFFLPFPTFFFFPTPPNTETSASEEAGQQRWWVLCTVISSNVPHIQGNRMVWERLLPSEGASMPQPSGRGNGVADGKGSLSG